MKYFDGLYMIHAMTCTDSVSVYIYIYYAFIWNSVGWGRGEPFRIPCAQTASIFSATGEAV